uniref:ANK_REP_REGION domain-containing protein n=1 Tax=Meloidogyne hapla TaxID=6305 RepID=A0A1I8BBE0_MELHA
MADSAKTTSDTGAWLDEHFPLHKAVFQNDISRITEILTETRLPKIDLDQRDTHGNTALHLAAMLGNIVGLLLSSHKKQSHRSLTSKLPEIQNHLASLNDFYMEIHWEFQTWIPLLSRVMPSDTFKVYKRDSKLRVDFTLTDFNESIISWTRGDMSLLFDPSAPKSYQTLLLNNKDEVYQRVRDKNRHLNDEIDLLMACDIISSHISTRPIRFVRAKGWFMNDKSYNIGEYKADLFHIKELCLITRKRREHLSQEDLRKNRELNKAFSDGKLPLDDTSSDDDDKDQHRPSLSPPPKPEFSWAEYLRLPDGPDSHLGRPKEEKTTNTEIKGMLALCQDFPLTTDQLLDILEVLEPVKPTVKKFRAFCSSGRLPPGFPIQLEIPIFATLTMKITVQLFRWQQSSEDGEFSNEMFKVPSHFREDPEHFNNI